MPKTESKNISDNNNKQIVSTEKKWIPYKDLLINSALFKKGIVAVTSAQPPLYGVEEDKSFYIKKRHFFFYPPSISDTLLKTTPPCPHSDHLKKAKHLLFRLEKFATSKNTTSIFTNSDVVLFNKKHKEEIFFPFVFNHAKKQIGTYIYPWIFNYDNNIDISGFAVYHTAGCLFGAALKGMDQNGSIFELIKHDIKFFQGQIIKFIIHESHKPNPYEEMLFHELEKFAYLIDIFSKPNQPRLLIYHLPYLDYVLFGIELFIHGKITLTALSVFFEEIFIKKDYHVKKINEICTHYNIEIRIESPFENLFGFKNLTGNLVEIIFNKLKISYNSDEIYHPDKNESQRKEDEENFVQYCLVQLKKNSFNKQQQQVWKDFGTATHEILTIEALLKIGNTIMLGLAAMQKPDYEVCSLLSLSEKQIQIKYNKYYEQYLKLNPTNSSQYAKVLNITTIDPLIAYSPITKGLSFYFNFCTDTLTKLINKYQILSYAYNNVAAFANKTKVTPNKTLQKLLIKYGSIEQQKERTKTLSNYKIERSSFPIILKIMFNQFQIAQVFQIALFEKGYEDAPGKIKQIHKLSISSDDNHDAKKNTVYAIKLSTIELEEIFPSFLELGEQALAKLPSSEKAVDLKQILSPSFKI